MYYKHSLDRKAMLMVSVNLVLADKVHSLLPDWYPMLSYPAFDPEGLLDYVERTRPKLVVFEVNETSLFGVVAGLKRLDCHSIAIVTEEGILPALVAGATGVCCNNVNPQHLVDAVKFGLADLIRNQVDDTITVNDNTVADQDKTVAKTVALLTNS